MHRTLVDPPLQSSRVIGTAGTVTPSNPKAFEDSCWIPPSNQHSWINAKNFDPCRECGDTPPGVCQSNDFSNPVFSTESTDKLLGRNPSPVILRFRPAAKMLVHHSKAIVVHSKEIAGGIVLMQSISQRHTRAMTKFSLTRETQPQIPVVRSPDAGIKAANPLQGPASDQSLAGRLYPAIAQKRVKDIAAGRRPNRMEPERFAVHDELHLTIDNNRLGMLHQRLDLPIQAIGRP